MNCPHCGEPLAERLGLTPRQREAYEFIRAFIDNHGYPPSYQELIDGIGLKSKSGAHRLLRSLCDRGWIQMMPLRARSIVLL